MEECVIVIYDMFPFFFPLISCCHHHRCRVCNVWSPTTHLFVFRFPHKFNMLCLYLQSVVLCPVPAITMMFDVYPWYYCFVFVNFFLTCLYDLKYIREFEPITITVIYLLFIMLISCMTFGGLFFHFLVLFIPKLEKFFSFFFF